MGATFLIVFVCLDFVVVLYVINCPERSLSHLTKDRLQKIYIPVIGSLDKWGMLFPVEEVQVKITRIFLSMRYF